MPDQLTNRHKLPRWRLEIFVALFSTGRMVIYLNHLDFLNFWQESWDVNSSWVIKEATKKILDRNIFRGGALALKIKGSAKSQNLYLFSFTQKLWHNSKIPKIPHLDQTVSFDMQKIRGIGPKMTELEPFFVGGQNL